VSPHLSGLASQPRIDAVVGLATVGADDRIPAIHRHTTPTVAERRLQTPSVKIGPRTSALLYPSIDATPRL